MRRLSLVLLIAVASIRSAEAQPSCASFDPDQGWTAAGREEFWFKTQGSRLMRYDWFLALEEPASTTLLKDSLATFGFMPMPTSSGNPDALPIGFTRDQEGANARIGLTCAACHTQRMLLKGSPVIIEGAASLNNFEQFMKTLEEALRRTVADEGKFNRFGVRVLGANPPPNDLARLKADVNDFITVLSTQWNANWPKDPSGPGRVDAFGQIFNRVTSHDIDVPGNARAANAPVSYPFLWNTPQLDRVQWNGSADNRLLGALGETFQLGPLARNLGEVLGVFGEVDVKAVSTWWPVYRSTVNLQNLKWLENQLKSLRPPRWPQECAPVDVARVNAGGEIYKKMCSTCHQVIDRTDLGKHLKAQLKDVKTDPAMLDNFRDRFLENDKVKTGILKGQPKILIAPRFKDFAQGQEILVNVTIGTLLGGGAMRIKGVPPPPAPEDTGSAALPILDPKDVVNAFRKQMKEAEESAGKYKARPLVGVWASAPFLHNGSVPTLADLLKPETCKDPSKPQECRPTTFYVGSTEFDLENVGFSTEPAAGAVRFDTALTGNSNRGHSGPNYGTELSEDDKRNLLEYLKVIGEPVAGKR